MLFLLIRKKLNNISIAIPTYNSSKYLSVLLENLSLINNVGEIVINDDNSSQSEIEKLKMIVEKNNKKHNIKIFFNNENFGGFKNKYIAVGKCTSDFVYQIDSDNIPNIKLLKKIINRFDLENFKNSLFLPSSINPFRFNHMSESKRRNKIVFSKKNMILNKNNIQSILENDSNVKYLLGLGNPIFHRLTYLDYLSEGLHIYKDIEAACSVALCYYWLKNEGNLHLLKDLHHFHRRHDDSYYLKKQKNSEKMAEDFFIKISQL